MNFESLLISIEQTHGKLISKANSQINYYNTLRNWLIGYFIVEFEQHGLPPIGQTLSDQLVSHEDSAYAFSAQELLNHLNFSHFIESLTFQAFLTASLCNISLSV